MNITIEPLNADNWYQVCQLSVSDEQKKIFTVPNVYWIGSSRYEEKNELFAIKYGDEYAGLIGGGLFEDGVSGLIEPVMVDYKFQRREIAEKALKLMLQHLGKHLSAERVYIEHKRNNLAAARVFEKAGFKVIGEDDEGFRRCIYLEKDYTILSLRDYPERANECRQLLLEHFNEFTSKHPAEVLASNNFFPQGYFMLKNDRVIGWAGLHEHEVVAGKVYGLVGSKASCSAKHPGWEGSLEKEDVMSEELSPWITPLLVHPDERGNRYGKMLLEYARREAGWLGFKVVYLTTGEIGYYEKYGFREVGLTTFTWGRPTKVYEHNTIKHPANKRDRKIPAHEVRFRHRRKS